VTLLLAAVLAFAPPHFPARPGWHVGAGRVQSCPGTTADHCREVTSFASTVPWRDCAYCLPHRTVATLPPDGIALQLIYSEGGRLPAWLRPDWPMHLVRTDAASLEGLPPRIGVVQQLARVGRRVVYLFVFFGRPTPTTAQLAAAQSELAGVSLP
jgi:hypothetical protein